MLLMAFRRRVAHMKNKAMGAMHEARSTESAPDTDKALADKVRTEMFRRPDAPKGAVNVSAVDGIVYLRGEVASDEEIQRLVDDALSVAGVLRVESLLPTPGTPAPTGGAG
jgi:osmotically-inducible protein OsmY